MAEIDTVLRSARTYLVQTLREIETTAGIEGGPSMDQRIRIREAGTYAIRQATKAVDQLYDRRARPRSSKAARLSGGFATPAPYRSTYRVGSAISKLSASTCWALRASRASFEGGQANLGVNAAVRNGGRSHSRHHPPLSPAREVRRAAVRCMNVVVSRRGHRPTLTGRPGMTPSCWHAANA